MSILKIKRQKIMGQIEAQREALEAKLADYDKVGECWEYRGNRNQDGYGRVYLCATQGRPPTHAFAHRIAYVFRWGVDPLENSVCHKCDNPACVNPAHLFLGSHADNMADMKTKGRSTIGAKNPTAKLTEELVVEIVAKICSGASNKQIALELPVSHSQVSLIRLGKSWTGLLAEIGYNPDEYRRFKRKAAA